MGESCLVDPSRVRDCDSVIFVFYFDKQLCMSLQGL